MDIDKLIEKLLSIRGNKPGKLVDLKEEELPYLIDTSLPIICDQKILIELEDHFMFAEIYMGNIKIY